MVKKLTDVHRVILATAAGRKGDQVLPLAATLGFKTGDESVVLMGMLARGLLAERPALDDEPVWRQDEDNIKIALMASPVGLAAIGIEPESSVPPEYGIRPAAKAKTAAKARVPAASKAAKTASAKTAPVKASAKPSEAAQPKRPASAKPASILATKGDKIVALLRRKQGATISDPMEATNWQAHSVRGFLAGTVKKKLGLSLISQKDKAGERRYRLEASSPK